MRILIIVLAGVLLAAPASPPAEAFEGAYSWLTTDAAPPPVKPHWSGLPVFGAEAAARGYNLPLPFGVGGTFYREQQPFDITNLKVSFRGSDLVSVKGFVELDRVDATQNVGAVRMDVWLFPFLNVYGLLGYMSGKIEGTVGLPAVPIRPPILVIPAQTLPLSIAYEGPVFGGGITLAGGVEVTKWRQLTAFLVLDANYTYTALDFVDERLEATAGAKAFIFSPRLGLRGQIYKSVFAAAWVGAMYQRVSETLEGRAPDRQIEFVVEQKPVAPWNALVGGRVELGPHVDLMVEVGIGTRQSVLGGLTFRF